MTATEQVTYRTLAEMFETRTRDNGETFVSLKDEAPEWARDFIREAHGVEFLPDDFRYAVVRDALEWMAEKQEDAEDDWDLSDEAHSFADGQVDVYTHNLTGWLHSDVRRLGYCDQAVEEGLVEPETDLAKRLMAGQFLEVQEVFFATIAAAKPYLTE